MNAHEGQVPLKVGDRQLTLRMDYRAVGALMTLLDDKDWPGAISKAFEDYDLDKVVRIIEIAAKRHHPDITAEEIFEDSPAFTVAYKAVEAALLLFLHGHPTSLENLDLSEPESQAKEVDGADPLPNGRVRWRALGRLRLNWLFRKASFG